MGHLIPQAARGFSGGGRVPSSWAIAVAGTLGLTRALETPVDVGSVVPGYQDDFRGPALSAGWQATGGERLVLSQPEPMVTTNTASQLVTNISWVLVEEVIYAAGRRWGAWSAGSGSSLELTDPRSDRRRASNCADSDKIQKAPWTSVEYSGQLDLGDAPANQLQVLLLGRGECMIDEVEVRNASGANLVANSDFSGGASGWTAEGTLSASGWDPFGGFGGGYHLRAVDRGDHHINRIRTPLTATLAAGSTATFRV